MSCRDGCGVLAGMEVEGDGIPDEWYVILSGVREITGDDKAAYAVLLPRHCERPCRFLPVLPTLCKYSQNVPSNVARDVLLHGCPCHRFSFLLLGCGRHGDREGEGRVEGERFKGDGFCRNCQRTCEEHALEGVMTHLHGSDTSSRLCPPP